MTTVSDGTTPPGLEPGSSPDPGWNETAPVMLPAAEVPHAAPPQAAPPQAGPPPAELPVPPPLLSHLQPEAQVPPEGLAGAPTPPPRRGLPRDTPSGAGRVILPIVLCLVGVVGVGAGWLHLESERAAEAQSRLAAAPAAKPPVPSLGSPAPSASTAPSTSPSAGPSAASSTAPSASSSGTTAAAPSTPSTPASPSAPLAPVADRSVAVVVLNATNRTGLAAEVAKRLRARGWTVVSIGNWRRGGVDTTTVFATGRADAAATMRRDAKPADATRPTLAGMPKNRIVLVIGPDFPRLT